MLGLLVDAPLDALQQLVRLGVVERVQDDGGAVSVEILQQIIGPLLDDRPTLCRPRDQSVSARVREWLLNERLHACPLFLARGGAVLQ